MSYTVQTITQTVLRSAPIAPHMPEWLKIILTGLIPGIMAAVVGILTLGVLKQQRRLAADKLRVDLFDRRYQAWLDADAAADAFFKETQSYRLLDSSMTLFRPNVAGLAFASEIAKIDMMFGIEVKQALLELQRVLQAHRNHRVMKLQGVEADDVSTTFPSPETLTYLGPDRGVREARTKFAETVAKANSIRDIAAAPESSTVRRERFASMIRWKR